MCASASRLLPLFLALCAGAGIGEPVTAADAPMRQSWALTATVFGSQEPALGLGHALGEKTWIFGSLTGEAWDGVEENATRFEDEYHDLEFSAVIAKAGMGIQREMVEWKSLRLSGGAAMGISWRRAKGTFLRDETGSRFSGERTDWHWDIGPCVEIEAAIRGPLSLGLFLTPIYYSKSWSREDGLISWIAETSPYKEHEQGLSMNTDPTLLARLRF